MTINPDVDYDELRKKYAEFLTWYDLGDIGSEHLELLGYQDCTKVEFAQKNNIDRKTLYNWENDSSFWDDYGFTQLQKMIRLNLPKAFLVEMQKGSGKSLLSVAYRNLSFDDNQNRNAITIQNNFPDKTENNKRESLFQKLYFDILDFCSKARIPSILHYDGRYINMHGGRSGGKSEIAARMVVWLLGNVKNGVLLCGREQLKSIKYSIKAILDRVIYKYGLNNLFVSTEQEIFCPTSGSKVIFLGMKAAVEVDAIKSIDNLVFFWGEEAQNFSYLTLEKADPTIRGRSSSNENTEIESQNEFCVEMMDGSTRRVQLLFTRNPELDPDPVAEYLETKKGEKKLGILDIEINYDQNPFCPKDEILLAETDKSVNYENYLHIWGGQPKKFFKDSLWPLDLVKKMLAHKNLSFDAGRYSRIVVGCDPAKTNKDFSNEYGLVVCGKTLDGIGHTIADGSGCYKPNEFAQKAIDLYYAYKADCIVVETNAAGDFVKSTILSIDPKIKIKEVWASVNKVQRAVPVSNLCQMGKIFHICGGFTKLESQAARMTNKGFEGAPGESPDRLEAEEWAYYELFGLSEKQTEELIFKSTMLLKKHNNFKVIVESVAYFGWDGDMYGSFICDMIQTPDNKMHFLVKDYSKGPKQNLPEYIENLLTNGFGDQQKIKEIHLPDDVTGLPIINNLSQKFVGINPILAESYITKAIQERVIQIIPYIQGGQLWTIEKMPFKKLENIQGDLFTSELTSYNPETKGIHYPIIAAVCNAIFMENNIIS